MFIKDDIYWNVLAKEFVVCLGKLSPMGKSVHVRPMIEPSYTYSTHGRNLVKLNDRVFFKLKALYGV